MELNKKKNRYNTYDEMISANEEVSFSRVPHTPIHFN